MERNVFRVERRVDGRCMILFEMFVWDEDRGFARDGKGHEGT